MCMSTSGRILLLLAQGALSAQRADANVVAGAGAATGAQFGSLRGMTCVCRSRSKRDDIRHHGCTFRCRLAAAACGGACWCAIRWPKMAEHSCNAVHASAVRAACCQCARCSQHAFRCTICVAPCMLHAVFGTRMRETCLTVLDTMKHTAKHSMLYVVCMQHANVNIQHAMDNLRHKNVQTLHVPVTLHVAACMLLSLTHPCCMLQVRCKVLSCENRCVFVRCTLLAVRSALHATRGARLLCVARCAQHFVHARLHVANCMPGTRCM
jgi:hypothetical protein